MRRFFTEPDNIDLDNGTLTIIDDAAHISKVLRMECGDKIIVFDGTGYEYEAMLIKIEKLTFLKKKFKIEQILN